MFLLDTNTLIYFFKGQGQVGEKLLATPPRELAVRPLDNLLAGIARCRRATLVTRNLREFRRVHGLMLVDWHG